MNRSQLIESLSHERITNADDPVCNQLQAIMEEAFPAEEQMEVSTLMRGVQAGTAQMLVYRRGSEVVAFAYVLTSSQMTYLLYFAVANSYRGMGIGGWVLDQLTSTHHGPFALDIETLQELDSCENPQQRKKRLAFYQKHGFRPAGYCVVDAEVTYDALCHGKQCKPEQHEKIMRDAYHSMGLDVQVFTY